AMTLASCLLSNAAAASEPTVGKPGLISGNDLYDDCRLHLSQQTICVGFIAGFIEGTHYWLRVYNTPEREVVPPLTCMGDGIRLDQAVEVAVDFLRNHPQDRHRSGAALLAAAYIDAFPCRQTQ
ncbi:MAG TPA: Rap1a/Tai family immunity protein, partial [Caulobacteraceae bacterium]|nr:Rap1a/Tai family immunity protein [Caulobacteraceae bacterium]